MTEPVQLNRTLGLPQMVLYGLGTTIGAGIYALIGELAGISGYMSPAAFLLASFLAGLTALSFAELSSRYPRAAGASLYVQQASGSNRFATVVGLLVVFAGVVSSAALINAFIGYLSQFIEISRVAGVIAVAVLIGVLAAWGIAQSVFIAGLITLIEIGGLILVIYKASPAIAILPDRLAELIPENISDWHAIYAGALLAFYAFIGFEDMVDVAEEIKDVKRNLPIAIILTLSITTVVYMLIMLTAILSIEPDKLASEKAPLVTLYQHYSGDDAYIIGIIGMFAIINGSLIQTIMASRVLYGLSSRGHIHAAFCQVNTCTRTPLLATLTVTVLILFFALTGDLAILAESTSLIILTVFALVNLSLLKIKKSEPATEGALVIPFWIPLLGFVVSAGFVVSHLVKLVH